MAHTNERDGGVDLVADWKVPKDPLIAIADKEDPYQIIQVVVQCKAYKNGVSKNDVQDIRDTVENRNYDGYFLAVSSYIKNSLADQLDRMRTNGKTWVDWWTQSEIEDRLKKNEELILKYKSILKSSKSVRPA
jgi:tRNA-dihydrouridine synthase